MSSDLGTPARVGVDPPAADRDALDLLCFRNLMASLTDIIYFKDAESRYLRMSRGAALSYGLDDPQALEGQSDADYYEAGHAANTYADERQIVETGLPMIDAEERQVWTDREDSWVSSTKIALRDDSGATVGTFGVSRDISDRVRAEARSQRISEALADSLHELRRVEADLRRVLEVSPDAIVRVDAELRWTYLNPAALALVGLPESAVLHRRTSEIVGLDEGLARSWGEAMQHVIESRGSAEIELATAAPRNADGDGGTERWLHSRLVSEIGPDGAVGGVLTVTRDLSVQKQAERQLEHHATHDPLTGLLNRRMLLDSLEAALGRADRASTSIALLFIDLDGFKEVNDALGHAEGDLVLRTVADRLRGACRAHDIVARLGGDEFIVVCEGLTSAEDVDTVARRIVGELSLPLTGAATGLRVPASVGVVTSVGADASAETLLRRADEAMYQAKSAGGSRWQRSKLTLDPAQIHAASAPQLAGP